MAVISCRNLVREFRQGDQVIKGLDNVTLDIEPGEMIVLSGPSGSGKTTLLNAVGALDTVDSGEVTVSGQRLDALTPTERAELRLHKIGFVFQAYNLIPVLSARENVELIMQVQGVQVAQRRQKASAILAEVGLSGMEGRRPAQLSGGQQQRVAVARAIVSEPEIVLADEPTANLDTASADQLMGIFLELNHHHSVTFIIATHDQRIMEYCRRKITMVDGRIVRDEAQPGKTAE